MARQKRTLGIHDGFWRSGVDAAHGVRRKTLGRRRYALDHGKAEIGARKGSRRATRARRSHEPVRSRLKRSDYCAGAGVAGAAGASGAGAGVSPPPVVGAGVSPPFPSTQLIKVLSYLQWCLWACTTTKTATITIKIRRIRIQTPSLFPPA